MKLKEKVTSNVNAPTVLTHMKLPPTRTEEGIRVQIKVYRHPGKLTSAFRLLGPYFTEAAFCRYYRFAIYCIQISTNKVQSGNKSGPSLCHTTGYPVNVFSWFSSISTQFRPILQIIILKYPLTLLKSLLFSFPFSKVRVHIVSNVRLKYFPSLARIFSPKISGTELHEHNTIIVQLDHFPLIFFFLRSTRKFPTGINNFQYLTF